MKRILVGISGASGAPIAIRLLQRLKESYDVETHLIMSDSACLTIEQETEYSVQQVKSLADIVYDIREIGAGPGIRKFSDRRDDHCAMLHENSSRNRWWV